jgi:hypothetical protein
MTEKANDSAGNEIVARLPRSFQLLAAWASERGLIAKPEPAKQENTARDKNGKQPV